MITSLYLSFSRTEPKMDSTGLEYILMGIGWSQECWGLRGGRSPTSGLAGSGASQEGQGPPEGHSRPSPTALPHPS